MLRDASTPTSPLASPSRLFTLTPSRRGIDWRQLDGEIKKIGRFLQSLNIPAIGWGLMLYDETAFCLRPCSNWFNNHTYQWLVNIGNANATLDGVKKGFAELSLKVNAFKSLLEQFSPQNSDDCSQDSQDLLVRMVDLQLMIDGVAKIGLKRLCENYGRTSWYESKDVVGLKRLGKDVFKVIGEIEAGLSAKIIQHLPDFKANLDLRRYNLDAQELISQRERYQALLRTTRHCQENGVIVQEDLIVDCKHNEGVKPKKLALQSAANFIKLPKLAIPIPTHDGSLHWVPVRPERTETGEIIFSSGTFGTCERDAGKSNDLCNLYHVFHPEAKQLVLGCGAINTRSKAEQICALISQEMAKCAKPERWMVLQLNSWWNEGQLIRDVHAQIPFLEDSLQKVVPDKKFSMMHLNLSFNAATIDPRENSRSVNEVNIDSLAQLVKLALDDTLHLTAKFLETPDEGVNFYDLTPTGETEENPPKPKLFFLSEFQQLADLCSQALTFAKSIRDCKEALRSTESIVLPESLGATSHASSSSGPNTGDTPLLVAEPSPLISSGTLGDSGVLTDSLDEISDESFEKVEDDKPRPDSEEIDQRLPSPIREQMVHLKEHQGNLLNILKDIASRFQPLIEKLNSRCANASNAPISRQIILIFRVIEKVLQTQLKMGSSDLSRCSEVELLLLLTRVLNVNPVITCWSGLDRSGCARALFDAQVQMEQLYYNRMKKEEMSEALGRVLARERVLKIITEFDSHRNSLFEETNLLMREIKVSPIIDLSQWEARSEANVERVNIKKTLFERIDQGMCPLSDPQLLKDTQNYLELVFKQMIGTEMEKTLFSTGVPGFKYHHERVRVVANPHPIERLPLTITTEQGQTIQILVYNSSRLSMSPLLSLTKAGLSITHRLSAYRGT